MRRVTLSGRLSRSSLKRSLMAALGVALMSFGALVPSAAQAPTENEVKAAYIFNFIRFVQWPGDAGAPDAARRLCVIGEDPFGPLLDAAAVEGPGGTRAVQPERLTAVGDAHRCHVLFVSDSEREGIASLLASLKGTHVLTVSDMPQFVRLGGIIQFTKQGDKVRFEINLVAARQAELVLSSELLRVASAIRR